MRAFDDQWVVYTRHYWSSNYMEIWKVNRSTGGGATQVTTQTAGDFDTDPDLSPDGTQVAFLQNEAGNEKLWVVGIDGTGGIEIDSTINCRAPMWHPDGSLILYRVGNTVVTIKPDGTNRTEIYTATNVRRPTWNRDGTLIGFQIDKTSPTVDELWVMNANGTGDAKVADMVSGGLGGFGFSWAHMSDVIAFSRGGSTDDVRKVNSNGTGETTITTGSLTRPALTRYAWSPDDTTVFTKADAANPWSIWQVPVSGSGESALSPALDTRGTVGKGQAFVFSDRIYTVDDSDNLVSVALDGSGERAEDGDSGATYFIELQGNATGL